MLRKILTPTAIAVLLAFTVGTMLTWLMAVRADREMRANLTQQSQLVMKAIDIKQAQALTGTEADLHLPAYQQIKKQFAAVCSANPKCRFIYLMGRKANGEILFLVDSEPPSSKNYSPPGQIYEEVSPEIRRVFDTKSPAVEGPLPDRWGVWITALVSMADPGTLGTIVLGMDFDASIWQWDVAAQAALPTGLILILLIIITGAFISAQRTKSSPKPVLRRLLPPLMAIFILLIAGTRIFLEKQHHQQIDDDIETQVSNVNNNLHFALEQQLIGLTAISHTIAESPVTKKALREGNAGQLLTAWRPLFETIRLENHVTH
ncbi:MAG: hypothetical protein WCG27_12185, partial [Pseudomonadota bacterium]